MANLFDEAARRLKGSPIVIWVHIASWIFLLTGLWHFGEDTYSSYLGIRLLEQIFHVSPANWDFTYWTMSVAPQVGQIIFLYIFALDQKKNKWALVLFIILFAVDYGADLQERSNGQFLSDGKLHLTSAVLVAAGMTTGYFTIGSEIFITIGVGLVLATFSDAVDQAIIVFISTKKTIVKARIDLMEANKKLEDALERYSKSRSGSNDRPDTRDHNNESVRVPPRTR